MTRPEWWRPAWARASQPCRRWQGEFIELVRTGDVDGGVASVIMGAGKAYAAAEIATSVRIPKGARMIVTAPTKRLVRQLAGTIRQRVGELVPGREATAVGMWFSDEHDARAITVACLPSLPSLLAHDDRDWLWIADEAHRTDHDAVGEALGMRVPLWRLALSATPYRADPADALRHWTREVYRYGVREALADGVLVPWQVDVPVGSGMVATDQWCLDWMRDQDGPGIVSADSIADAEVYAEWLTAHGVAAAAVHSQLAREVEDARIEALRTGQIRALVHVRLLTEGVDLPWLRWLCLRAARGSRVGLMQGVGRVLRSHPGKDGVRIADPHGLLARVDMQAPAALGAVWERRAPKVKAAGGDVLPPVPDEVRREAARDALLAERVRMRHGVDLWARLAIVVAVNEGLADAPRPMKGPATDRQVAALTRFASWAGRKTEPHYAACARLVLDAIEAAKWGGLSKRGAGVALSLTLAMVREGEAFVRALEAMGVSCPMR